ncbi:AAA family ATPase [Cnuibacter sp. UC19_7]|uniref:AAA family ATPase n=1 Tax=Cnuibacter sp. UC19_7 TaxID=3350166 RepID=UPI00366B983C
MTRVLVTGMSGAGKSTLLSELARRGHRTLDTDYDGWTNPDGLWDAARMRELLQRARVEGHPVIVSGTVENQPTFYPDFDRIVLLTAPLSVLLERVSTRTGNPYGRRPGDLAEIRHHTLTIEPLLRPGATDVLDACRPTTDLADEVEHMLA